MPRHVSSRLAAACALALLISLATAAMAVAKGTSANLRVVAGQQVLVDKTLETDTVSIKTSAKATCFGPGSAGSGKSVKVSGPTPLGLLAQAARTTASLRPLYLTDAFSFGLGICTVGGKTPKGEGFWQLRVNHEASELGGDAVKLKKGDDVLWYLAAAFPAPPELFLQAPTRAQANKPFSVRVFSYDEKGKRKPAAGVKVSGAQGTTGADGRISVKLAKPGTLVARGGGAIPSNRVAVCVAGKCPKG